ncbi:MAG: thiamine pyrophosphate-binding protein [Nitrosarchaeum sp.]|nr:thiamine pyrophosphate-binding protein [Nitrosarchaeum sp.]
MKVSDYVNLFLQEKGVQFVFEMSGGMITHLLDSIYKENKIKLISMHHEQSAAFAADAVGRITGIPGVAMATSGPGATNLITGIGSSFFDSSPTVFITGQVNRDELKKNDSIRQLGFQETDIVSIVKPITKRVWQVRNPEEIPHVLEMAFEIATSDRPGPVLIDIPMDVQRHEIFIENIKNYKTLKSQQEIHIDKSTLQKLFDDLKNAKRPLILAGGGINSSRSIELFREFIKIVKIPVVNSLMAMDVLPYNNYFRIGFIGSYGNRWANLAIAKSDFILVLGSRLDIRQTGSQTEDFRKNKIIYHVDCEKGEINNRITDCIELISDLQSFFLTSLNVINNNEFKSRGDWINEINSLKTIYPDTLELNNISGINPNIFMHNLSKNSSNAIAYVTDVGQHQMWAAQSLELNENQKFITCGGMGSMGFGLPAAIGTSLSYPHSPVILIAGDGGFQSNIQEIQTVLHHKLPIKMIIFNNNCHGMVRQFQEDYFEGRYQSTLWGYSSPNFETIATAYGIKSKTITNENEINDGIKWIWDKIDEPVLLQVMIDTFTNTYPKIGFGKHNYDMDPKIEELHYKDD